MHITNNGKDYSCTGSAPCQSGMMFTVEGLTLPVTGELKLISDDDGFVLAEVDCSEYARQTYEGGVLTLTNEPVPVPPTAEQLLAAARDAAYSRIKGKCSEAIMSGVTVSGKHYTLTELDQLSLSAALGQVNAGMATVMYAADGEALSAYTAAQIRVIHTAAYNWGLCNRVYYALLYAWIERETDTATLAAVSYGSKLPDDMTAALTAQLTAAGIDASALAGMLT